MPRRCRQHPGAWTQEVGLPCQQHPRKTPSPARPGTRYEAIAESATASAPAVPAPTSYSSTASTAAPGRRCRRRSQCRVTCARRRGRGERTAVPAKKTVAELAAEWLDRKTRLPPRTRKSYEDAPRLGALPTFGDWQVKAVDAEVVARLIRGLEAEGLR